MNNLQRNIEEFSESVADEDPSSWAYSTGSSTLNHDLSKRGSESSPAEPASDPDRPDMPEAGVTPNSTTHRLKRIVDFNTVTRLNTLSVSVDTLYLPGSYESRCNDFFFISS